MRITESVRASMEESRSRTRSMDKLSWRGTLLIQAALCVALYGALSIGTPQESSNLGLSSRRTRRRDSLDLYFLSVRGGFWPADEQTQLLQQMGRAVEFFKAKFVVNIGELGEDDPLMQNATLYFPLLKIPWYTTTVGNATMALPGKSKKCFLRKIKIGIDQTLDLVGVDTGLLQDLPCSEQSKESGSDQLDWLQHILSVTDSKWRIVVGFHPLTICRNQEQNSIEFLEPLHRIFLKHGVNAYLSKQGCGGHLYSNGGIAYVGNPGPLNSPESGSIDVFRDRTGGFLLHRVTPFEIESYYINSGSMVLSISKIYQHGGVII
ncbi:hypothetical protein KSP39_PZI021835 [Platanthera zijinensis]|uniref:Calcineurin-like phosphoesterase domain-containing protein n=1 Tax=Platanthera zijinensis TaxID=2320716 RepID=A0AAP0FVB4_9ASPA